MENVGRFLCVCVKLPDMQHACLLRGGLDKCVIMHCLKYYSGSLFISSTVGSCLGVDPIILVCRGRQCEPCLKPSLSLSLPFLRVLTSVCRWWVYTRVTGVGGALGSDESVCVCVCVCVCVYDVCMCLVDPM